LTINIAKHEFTIIWDNVYYFSLSNFPYISDWELKKLLLFIEYEKNNNRETKIVCENKNILEKINYVIKNPDQYLNVNVPKKITECIACNQKGCITDYLCHTASIEDAKSIFNCGKILSAVKARKKTGIELVKEQRNAANDPPDFFDYIMFSWGNCQAGDRLIMERLLKRDLNENDLSINFKPGVRYYFKYKTIIEHNDFVNDGYHPAKIKNEIILYNNLYCCIIPEQYKTIFLNIIPQNITNKIHYLENNCKNIFDWSEKVYNYISKL
jgi:hypothetical protein